VLVEEVVNIVQQLVYTQLLLDLRACHLRRLRLCVKHVGNAACNAVVHSSMLHEAEESSCACVGGLTLSAAVCSEQGAA
jgi:hypothetical protein